MTRVQRARDEVIAAILKDIFYGGDTPLRGVYYERVSTKRQAKGTSLETQALDIERWAESHRVALIDKYVDPGRSGRYDRRPQFRRLMDDLPRLQAQGVKVILIWKLDRF